MGNYLKSLNPYISRNNMPRLSPFVFLQFNIGILHGGYLKTDGRRYPRSSISIWVPSTAKKLSKPRMMYFTEFEVVLHFLELVLIMIITSVISVRHRNLFLDKIFQNPTCTKFGVRRGALQNAEMSKVALYEKGAFTSCHSFTRGN